MLMCDRMLYRFVREESKPSHWCNIQHKPYISEHAFYDKLCQISVYQQKFIHCIETFKNIPHINNIAILDSDIIIDSIELSQIIHQPNTDDNKNYEYAHSAICSKNKNISKSQFQRQFNRVLARIFNDNPQWLKIQ